MQHRWGENTVLYMSDRVMMYEITEKKNLEKNRNRWTRENERSGYKKYIFLREELHLGRMQLYV